MMYDNFSSGIRACCASIRILLPEEWSVGLTLALWPLAARVVCSQQAQRDGKRQGNRAVDRARIGCKSLVPFVSNQRIASAGVTGPKTEM